ncbi:hypothetical protein ABK040_004704 [Willaertia magna]
MTKKEEKEASSSTSNTDDATKEQIAKALEKCIPIGEEDGKPIYDRTGVDIFPKKPHIGQDKRPLCAFGGSKKCTQRPMKGHDFCIKHILQDPTAPFKQCEYIGKNNKNCGNPVKIGQDDPRYCNAHKQKLGILPKGQSGYSKKKKTTKKSKKDEDEEYVSKEKESTKETPKRETRKRRNVEKKKEEKKEEEEEEIKEIERETTTKEIVPEQPSSSSTVTTATCSTTAPGVIINTSTSEIYPVPCESGSDTETDEEFQGKSSAPIKESTTPQSALKKRKRKFKKSTVPGESLESETETEEPTDDEEFNEEMYLFPPRDYLFQPRDVLVSELEYLRIRKQRIEKLLFLYQQKHYEMRKELEMKYNEFLRQREIAANLIVNGDYSLKNNNNNIKLRLKRVNYKDYYNPKNLINNQDIILPTVNFPPENHQIYTCEKVTKVSQLGGELLCSYPQCFNKRILGCEFCFQHILYDSNQRLYTAGPGGVDDPIYACTTGDEQPSYAKIPTQSLLSERTIVVIENGNKLLDKQQQDNKLSEQEKKITRLLKKFKGMDNMDEETNHNSSNLSQQPTEMDTSSDKL